jgi:putative ABC transport system ATP-binding protein
MTTASTGKIELHGVGKRYGAQVVLADASASIAPGELVVVLGRSGSGKSTLLRLIGGLESPDEGAVRLDGRDLVGLTETARAKLRRASLGFVFQFFNLIPTLTAGENVELPLALNGVRGEDARRRSTELLAELHVATCVDRFPEEISGGEQQRVAIARALVHEPKVVLADEPTGNLDLETARQVLELLTTTCRRRRTTLIMATHSREAAALADRVLSIRNCRIEEGAA